MNRLLVWNCRGAGSLDTHAYLMNMLQAHRPAVVALLETRVPSDRAKKLIQNSYLTNYTAVEAVGFAGGIWLLWDRNLVEVEALSHFDQVLNVGVQSGSGKYWLLSIMYASPNPLWRSELWHYLMKLGSIVEIPWLLIGDFNQVLDVWDKVGGNGVNRS